MEIEKQHVYISTVEVENLSDALFSGDEENGGSEERKTEINGNWIPATSITEAKINAKAKRRLRKNSSRDSGRGDSVSENGETQKAGLVVPTSPKGKVLDRRSRSGKGRGLPKKGGAGGKGVWGTPGQVYDVEEVDIKDPNYDDDQVGKQTSLLGACFDFILIKITVMLILINVKPHKLYGCLTSCIKRSLFLV